MSRFDNLDAFLQREEERKKRAFDETVQRREQSRQENDPLVKKAFDIFGDYFINVLKPRKELSVARKFVEQPEFSGNVNEFVPFYLYLLNLVPTDNPYAWPIPPQRL